MNIKFGEYKQFPAKLTLFMKGTIVLPKNTYSCIYYCILGNDNITTLYHSYLTIR